MKIGFYGHSAAAWYGNTKSFIDQTKIKFNADIVNIGVAQGSEERVLFELKKTKKIDVAIIFHQIGPKYMFMPKCNRDLSFDAIPENKAKILWSENHDNEVDNASFINEFFSYGKVKEVFNDEETFIRCMKEYKEYFSHPDLQRNRFESATLMVDTYCRSKVPNVIHVSDYPYDIAMPWFKFTSGIVSDEIQRIVNDHREVGNNFNNISDEGNCLIAEEISKIITNQNWDQQIN